MDIEKFIKEFESSTDEGRWNLVQENQDLNIVVMLDNDSTTLICDGDDEIYLSFDNYIGNSGGITDLLNTAGIKAEHV